MFKPFFNCKKYVFVYVSSWNCVLFISLIFCAVTLNFHVREESIILIYIIIRKKLHRDNKWQNQIRIKQLLISSKSWNTLNGLFCYFWSQYISSSSHRYKLHSIDIARGEYVGAKRKYSNNQARRNFWRQVRKNMEVQSYELIRAFLVQKEPPQDFR